MLDIPNVGIVVDRRHNNVLQATVSDVYVNGVWICKALEPGSNRPTLFDPNTEKPTTNGTGLPHVLIPSIISGDTSTYPIEFEKYGSVYNWMGNIFPEVEADGILTVLNVPGRSGIHI